MTTRPYVQRARAEGAADTRRRILDAVAERLRKAPTEALSLDHVATDAGVARSTIYVVFGSKAGLFDAFTVDLMERSGLADLTEAVAAADARQHLRGGILAGCRMMANELEIHRVLTAMSRIDPDSVGGAILRLAERRRGGMEYLATRLHEDGALRDDVTVEEATDLLWMLCSLEAFDLLYTDRELTVEEAADLLATTAERTLCT